MKLQYTVIVKTGAEKREVSQRNMVIHVATQAKSFKVNDDVIQQLAEYFNVPPSHVRVVNGEKSKQKIVEVI